MSALSASCGKNLSSVCRKHSLTETMNLSTALLLRLERHLHMACPPSYPIYPFWAYCDTYYSDFGFCRQEEISAAGRIFRSFAGDPSGLFETSPIRITTYPAENSPENYFCSFLIKIYSVFFLLKCPGYSIINCGRFWPLFLIYHKI